MTPADDQRNSRLLREASGGPDGPQSDASDRGDDGVGGPATAQNNPSRADHDRGRPADVDADRRLGNLARLTISEQNVLHRSAA